jgi:hypothetical protein
MTLEQSTVATVATAATIAAAASATVTTVVAGDGRLFAAQQGEADNREENRDAQN